MFTKMSQKLVMSRFIAIIAVLLMVFGPAAPAFADGHDKGGPPPAHAGPPPGPAPGPAPAPAPVPPFPFPPSVAALLPLAPFEPLLNIFIPEPERIKVSLTNILYPALLICVLAANVNVV